MSDILAILAQERTTSLLRRHAYRWCREHLLTALGSAESQGVLREVLEELLDGHPGSSAAIDAISAALSAHGRVHTRVCGLGLPRTKAPKPRWPKTVNDLVREWGYARTRIAIAAERAGVTLARGPRRSYLVTEAQAAAIRAELAKHPDGTRLHRVQHGEWGKGGHPPACIDCGRSDRPRHARDRCAACDHLTRTA